MAELKELFKRRDETVERLNNGIINAIPNVVDAAQHFVREREGTKGNLVWKDISLLESEGYVMLIGVLEYEVGEVVLLPNGMEFQLTEDTLEHFKRIIRLGVPYALAAEGSKDKVLEFFEQSAAEAEAEALEDDFDDILQLPVSDVDNTEFDLDALTEEQKQQLKLFALSHGGNN